MICEKCKKIERRPLRMKTNGYLWVYQELENATPRLYATFLTEDEAEDTFKDKFAYRKLTSRDISRGISL